MNQHRGAIGDRLMKTWQRLSPWPGGRWLFSLILGQMAPYTGTIGARVKEIRPGYARVELRDRRKLRNHLHSIHAIALMNLGEVASGLAMASQLPPDFRGIITRLSIEFVKKARGRLVAESHCHLPQLQADIELEILAEIRDQSGDTVARCTANWRLGPIP